MSLAVFVKRYADAARAQTARANLRWLAQLHSGVLIPRLRPGDGTRLVFDHVPGRRARAADLLDLSAALGQLHGVGYTHQLHAARLDQPYHASSGLTIPDFHAGRRRLLDQLGIDCTGLHAALYKDANIRNFVVTGSGPAIVDFDDLTLAPFGYDLAKLVVSTAMTFGHLPSQQVEAALEAYNRRVTSAGGPAASCTLAQLAGYAELHHHLTSRYLHRNGYRHPWPNVRPWPDPTSVRGHH